MRAPISYYPYTHERKLRLTAFTDGLLRRTTRLARIQLGETQSALLGRLLAKERRRLWHIMRQAGLRPELLERADQPRAGESFPDLPAPDAPPIDDVGPRE